MKAKERAAAAHVEIVRRIWSTGNKVQDAGDRMVIDVANEVLAEAIRAAECDTREVCALILEGHAKAFTGVNASVAGTLYAAAREIRDLEEEE